MQQIYEEDNKSTFEHLGWQGTFKSWALWSVSDGKGLSQTGCMILRCSKIVLAIFVGETF
jgi:hypothetical protein